MGSNKMYKAAEKVANTSIYQNTIQWTILIHDRAVSMWLMVYIRYKKVSEDTPATQTSPFLVL